MKAQNPNQIARRIHDGIAQDLVAFGYSLDQALGAPELPISTRTELRTLRFGVTDLLEKVRREIWELRTPKIEISKIAEEICGSLLGKVDIKVEIPQQLIPIIVELLRNSVNHSGASLINLLSYSIDAFTVIEVSDNGIGGVQMKRDRFGLIGVIESAHEHSGQVEILDLSPGLLVRVSIPK